MNFEAGEVVEVGRSHLIKRPRLTRLLDSCEARIILLVAPAGYGKTTLAREWLSDKPHGWYRGNSASADVAALALGIARAASLLVPGADERLATRLRVSSGPNHECDSLAEILAKDLRKWPEDSWLMLDDYHFACDSETSERFVKHLAEMCPIRLLIASRSRPAWASARLLLYGEVYEVGRNLLAMNPDEAHCALSHVAPGERGGLIALADGWPALLGLAAVAEPLGPPSSGLPDDLYTYFLDELYKGLPPRLQKELRVLALPPSVTLEVALNAIGKRARPFIQEVVGLGLLQASARDRYEFHPLLRGFLASQFRPEDDPQGQVVQRLVQILTARGEWDQAFEVVHSNFSDAAFADLLTAALPRMVDEARLPTLAKWIEAAIARDFDSPLLDLAESEVAFKTGDLRRAEATAVRASSRFSFDDSARSKALWLAGTSAHLACREQDALEYFLAAREAAASENDTRQALWGQFLAIDGLEQQDAAERTLTELVHCSGDSVDEMLRIATGRFRLALLSGNIGSAIDDHLHLASLVGRSRDPLILGSFVHAYLWLLALSGRYAEVVQPARDLLKLAMDYSLGFVVPLAHLHLADAAWGVGDYRTCSVQIGIAERANHALKNEEILNNASVLRAKILLARKRLDKGIEALDNLYPSVAKGNYHAEYLAWWSLVAACARHRPQALTLAERADRMSKRVEVIGVTTWTRAIIDGREEAMEEAFRSMKAVGHVDAFVAAYRGKPEILNALAKHESHRHDLRMILEAARDFRLAESIGLRIQSSDERPLLTKREREVIELVSQGMTNREIGRTLYIEETTVKVHVRKICQKLGVRSRTEAAMRAAELAG